MTVDMSWPFKGQLLYTKFLTPGMKTDKAVWQLIATVYNQQQKT